MHEAYTPPFHMTDEITALAIEIGEMIGRLSVSAGLSPDPTLRRESHIRRVYSSLAIEHNTLSLDQVTDVIDGHRVLGPPKDIREVKNAYEAYERLNSLNPASQEDLLLAHRLMMQDLIPDAGCYRSRDVGVYSEGQLIHAGTPAAYVPEVMNQLFSWLNDAAVHPLIAGCIFHYEFEFIHPFSDGNGRTGRLWHSLILQRWQPIFAWLPVESMIHEHQAAYYQALGASDSTAFVTLMLTIIRDILRDLRQNASEDGHVNGSVNGSVNEETILLILQKRPKATIKQIAAWTHLSVRQVSRLLAGLKDSGKIIRHGAPKNGYWEVSSN